MKQYYRIEPAGNRDEDPLAAAEEFSRTDVLVDVVQQTGHVVILPALVFEASAGVDDRQATA